MGCDTFPIWIGIVIATAVVIVILTILIISRNWKAVKFFLFMRFNILINDETKSVDDMEFDAFVAYRWAFYVWIGIVNAEFQFKSWPST